MKIPMTAQEWQLFTSMEGANEVAKVLYFTLKEFIENTPSSTLLDEKKTESRARFIRDEMYEIMNQYSHFGARDTEPECVLVETIENALRLPRYSLER